MLAIVVAGFLAMTINWFNISTGFAAVGEEFGLAIPEVTLLISVFVVTYGLLHVPGGFLAAKWVRGGRWRVASPSRRSGLCCRRPPPRSAS